MMLEVPKTKERKILDFLAACQQVTIEHLMIALSGASEDHSFFLSKNERQIGFVALPVARMETPLGAALTAQFLGMSLPPPVFVSHALANGARPDFRAAVNEVERVCRQENIAQARFNLTGATRENADEFQWQLRKGGYHCVMYEKLVLDLSEGCEPVRRNMSKGHRSDIARWGESLETKFVGWDDVGGCLGLLKDTFDISCPYQFRSYGALIRRGMGEICLVMRDGTPIGGAIFMQDQQGVEYVLAKRSAAQNIPVHTIAIWRAIERYAGMGIRRMDLGVVTPGPSLDRRMDVKKAAIAQFKRSLGATLEPFAVFERFFDPRFADWIIRQRAESFLSSRSSDTQDGP